MLEKISGSVVVLLLYDTTRTSRVCVVLAYVFGRRQDDVLRQHKQLLEPFGITRFYTDGWGAYERHLDEHKHVVGKQHMQRIESKHINLRTRIKRLGDGIDTLIGGTGNDTY